MPLHLYNTLTRRVEPFQPANPPRVTYYNCGPTVYDAFTIGNARNFIVGDVLRRWLEASGYQVSFVQNLTDVDDKIIQRAEKEGRTATEVAAAYTEVYFKYADRLGVRRANNHPKATEHITPMQQIIAKLIAKGHAYASEGDVYFDVASYPDYGKLSGKKLDDMEQGERVDAAVVSRKKSPKDFALWKGATGPDDLPQWTSAWGPGRPGWHIECSAMSWAHLGETIDLHSGGEDLIFPHHENEVAQSQCAHGVPFVRHWVHNGFLTFGEKVSKSTMTDETRAMFMIDRALERFSPEAIRYFLLTGLYRSPLGFSLDGIKEAEARCDRLRRALAEAREALASRETLNLSRGEEAGVTALAKRFRDAMDDDLNTPQALAAIADGMTRLNALRATETGASSAEFAQLYQLLGEQLEVLGLKQFLFDAAVAAALSDPAAQRALDALIAARNAARKTKQFAVSDAIRKGLDQLGIALEDTPKGTKAVPPKKEPKTADVEALLASIQKG